MSGDNEYVINRNAHSKIVQVPLPRVQLIPASSDVVGGGRTGAILDPKSFPNSSWRAQTSRAVPSMQLKNFLTKRIRISCFAFHYYFK